MSKLSVFFDICRIFTSESFNGTRCRSTMFLLLINHIESFFVENNQHLKSKKSILFPKHHRILEELGENIKLARKRRKLTTIQTAERAGIDCSTLYEIERGNPSVSMGGYFNVLRVLGLQDDFLKLAADDIYGRKLQDIELLTRNDGKCILSIEI